jgi:allantoinase
LKGTGSVLLFHAEVDNFPPSSGESDPTKYETFLESRPPVMENEAISMVIGLCRESGNFSFTV